MIDPVDARKYNEPYRGPNGEIVSPPYESAEPLPSSLSTETQVNSVAQGAINPAVSTLGLAAALRFALLRRTFELLSGNMSSNGQ